MCVVGSSSRVSRACIGSVNSLKLSTVQITKGESVLWNDCPIATGTLAMALILAARNYCRTGAADPRQPSINAPDRRCQTARPSLSPALSIADSGWPGHASFGPQCLQERKLSVQISGAGSKADVNRGARIFGL